MRDKQALDAKTLKQLIANNSMLESPEIDQLREQLNECVRSYE